MAQTKIKIAFGLISFLVMASGIAYSVLCLRLAQFVMDRFSLYGEEFATSKWLFGFAYGVPGLIGLISSAVQKKSAYNIHSFFALIAVCAGMVYIINDASKGAHHFRVHPCQTVDGKCHCESSVDALLSFFTCSEINYMIGIEAWIGGLFFGGGIHLVIAMMLSYTLTRGITAPTVKESKEMKPKEPRSGVEGEACDVTGYPLLPHDHGVDNRLSNPIFAA